MSRLTRGMLHPIESSKASLSLEVLLRADKSECTTVPTTKLVTMVHGKITMPSFESYASNRRTWVRNSSRVGPESH